VAMKCLLIMNDRRFRVYVLRPHELLLNCLAIVALLQILKLSSEVVESKPSTLTWNQLFFSVFLDGLLRCCLTWHAEVCRSFLFVHQIVVELKFKVVHSPNATCNGIEVHIVAPLLPPRGTNKVFLVSYFALVGLVEKTPCLLEHKALDNLSLLFCGEVLAIFSAFGRSLFPLSRSVRPSSS